MEPTLPCMQYGFAGWCLEPATRRLLTPDGSVVALNDRAFDTLTCLVMHAGQTLTKDFLLNAVWAGENVEENNLNQAILVLRKALGDDSRKPRFIRTVARRGFCFVAAVEPLSLPVPTPTPVTRRPAWMLPAAAIVLLVLGGLLLWPATRPEPAARPAVAETFTRQKEVLPDSLAVLPFRSLGSTAPDAAMATEFHTGIISRLPGIQVSDPEHAASIMSGTVLQTGERTRINLELVDSRSHLTLWTESYEIDSGNLHDILAVQADITHHVARTLGLPDACEPLPKSLHCSQAASAAP